MDTHTMSTKVALPYDEAVAAVRDSLADAGFGVLTEIDLAAKLKEKVGADVAPAVILGACRPELAHRAYEADPSVASLLPCNVVVRVEGDTTVVEALDPAAMVSLVEGDHPELSEVMEDARKRLASALDALPG